MGTILSLMMLTVLALCGGAAFAWRRGQRKQAGLMLVLAAVMAVNVGIWTLPDESGRAPISQELK